ncbi:allophanate hydrolase subunit 2 family protein, partial [Cohnella xylanilytica]|nr:allophanate hydrolase subunit 2 family protein [Cohnella xylanilytica]
ALELTLLGGEFRAERDVLVAVAGAEFDARVEGDRLPMGRPVLLRRGALVSFGPALRGCRAYLAVAGGIDVPPALGSRGTDAR